MRIRSLLSCFLISGTLFFSFSCSRDAEIISPEQIVSDDFRLMSVAYYRDAPDGNSIGIRFYESPAIISLSKSAPAYNKIKSLLDDAIQNKKPLSVHINPSHILVDAKVTTPIELNIFNDIWFHHTDTVADPKFYRAVISMDELNQIFDYMAAQGCATGTAEIDQCISFQYVVDGCYARAHKMRQILNEKYNVSCEKVYSYEGPSGSLAVDAGDCCVFWWYHVAPLMTVSTLTGPRKFVMDPSMFDHPVTIEEWTSAQENYTCTPYADFGYFDIQPGWTYSPGWGGDYASDDNYYWTNWTLNAYEDLITCD